MKILNNKDIFFKNYIPPQIYQLANIFNQFNFKLYLVGGCVRDYLLQKIPNDFDFTTSAKTYEILEILKDYQTFKSGEKYGTIGVIFNNIKCEITTFRSDGSYFDNRHPSIVLFHDDITMDLKRRDFTINALAYDILNDEIIDEFNGISDLKNKIIRCVGNPNERFREDSLRILRAFSFLSKLDFCIENTTLEVIKNSKELLINLKIERIRNEILKILCGENPKKTLTLMKKNDILEIKNIPSNINKIPSNIRIYASFLIFKNPIYFNVSLGKKISIMRDIFFILDSKKNKFKDRKTFLAKLCIEFGIKDVEQSLIIKSKLNKKYRILKKAFKKREIESNLNLKINGNEISDFGFEGKEIQIIKKYLLEKITKFEIKNNKKELLKTLKGIKENNKIFNS